VLRNTSVNSGKRMVERVYFLKVSRPCEGKHSAKDQMFFRDSWRIALASMVYGTI
jgi:hypothetical protein